MLCSSFMGLLNHLFGSRRAIARELGLDADARIKLWETHLENHRKREEISKFFNRGNIENALNNPEQLEVVLKQLDDLISRDIIDIEGEEKLEDEILLDIKLLVESDEIRALNRAIAEEPKKQEKLKELFRKIHNMLLLELHIIKRLRQGALKKRELLHGLFNLVFYNEAELYALFREELYFKESRDLFGTIKNISRSILLEQEFDESKIAAETEFINMAIKRMGPNSRHSFRKLGEDIFRQLMQIAEDRMEPDYDLGHIVTEMERLMYDDNLMMQLLIQSKDRLKLSEEETMWTIKAFRKAYGHFENLLEE